MMSEFRILCHPFGVVGMWGLPMAVKVMCMLFGSPFFVFRVLIKTRDV